RSAPSHDSQQSFPYRACHLAVLRGRKFKGSVSVLDASHVRYDRCSSCAETLAQFAFLVTLQHFIDGDPPFGHAMSRVAQQGDHALASSSRQDRPTERWGHDFLSQDEKDIHDAAFLYVTTFQTV